MSTETQKEFKFDAKFFACFTIKAGSEAEARKNLEAMIDGGVITVGGETGITATAALDGELDWLDE